MRAGVLGGASNPAENVNANDNAIDQDFIPASAVVEVSLPKAA